MNVEVDKFDEELEMSTIRNSFNESITLKEITSAIHALKCNTSVGFDCISNEMLKNCSTNMLQCICKLFNLIYESGKYPVEWTESIIKPLFKAGSETDPNNYRGISISSCLSKLFSRVLYNRMDKFVTEHNILTESQIGFRKTYRPTDHIFTLKSIIDKYLRSKDRVYSCFVDLRKAFDTVWREAMSAKIKKYGINGKLYEIIKSMYSTVKYSVKLSTGLTSSFSSNVGVKQGCILSPLLFNLFINDFPKALDHLRTDPVYIDNIAVNCLMYADDIVMLSTSKEGLQYSLDSLHEYSKKWKLEVNTSKTQIVIFNKGGKLIKDKSFHFGDITLQTVQEYKYLGIILKSSGIFSSGISYLSKKALKVVYMIRSKFHTSEINAKLLLRVFDACVKPILLYGSELWSVFNLNLSKKLSGQEQFSLEKTFENFMPEKIHTRFCKFILGVNKYASNIASKAELGRFPMAVSALLQSVKYWLYLLHNPFEKARRLSYLTLIHNDGDTFGTFNHSIGCLLKYLGFSHVWNNKGTMSVNKLTHAIKKVMLAKYEKYFTSVITASFSESQSSNKLRTYCKFKQRYTFENYLLANFDKSVIAKLTKFRISNHRLEIEVGRYSKTPAHLRFCKTCNLSVVEDEFHFICICNVYSSLRTSFFNNLSKIVVDFNNLSLFDKFIYVMSSQDIDIISLVLSYVEACFEARKKCLEGDEVVVDNCTA